MRRAPGFPPPSLFFFQYQVLYELEKCLGYQLMSGMGYVNSVNLKLGFFFSFSFRKQILFHMEQHNFIVSQKTPFETSLLRTSMF